MIFLLLITIFITLITICILWKRGKQFHIIGIYYDGYPLYHTIKRLEKKYLEGRNNHYRCLNGGIPILKNDLFSGCTCPNKYIGFYCQYENLLKPDDNETFIL